MLLGEYRHNVDTKGRVSVPSKFRADLGQSFVVTKGLDNCLFVYSKKEWETFENKLKELPLTNNDARSFMRFFFAGATECEVDKQGRIIHDFIVKAPKTITENTTDFILIFTNDFFDQIREYLLINTLMILLMQSPYFGFVVLLASHVLLLLVLVLCFC